MDVDGWMDGLWMDGCVEMGWGWVGWVWMDGLGLRSRKGSR